MNAGCYGAEIWNYVQQVELINRKGERLFADAAQFNPSYRHGDCPADHWFIAAELALSSGDEATLQQEIRELLGRRAATQPTSFATAGSVFRNPPGDYAARLIEAAGLKGLRCGDAVVSEKHANFIVNSHHASAADIENLIITVQQRVADRFAVHLAPEVKIIGEPTTTLQGGA
ncbi:MAG: hypothetical protein HQL49_13840 [Gammaproteobacteria bacterium]|nr:hypothetical protein [Gammaproteobacteria bacterium]